MSVFLHNYMIMPFDCSEFADSPYSNVYIFWTKLV